MQAYRGRAAACARRGASASISGTARGRLSVVLSARRAAQARGITRAVAGLVALREWVGAGRVAWAAALLAAVRRRARGAALPIALLLSVGGAALAVVLLLSVGGAALLIAARGIALLVAGWAV